MKRPRTILIIPAFNEEPKLAEVLRRVRAANDVKAREGHPTGREGFEAARESEAASAGIGIDEMVVVDDGSTDDSAEVARRFGATVLQLDWTQGVGAALRKGLNYARERGAEVAVIMAGNNKDEPHEIPRLTGPILSGDADLVIGSRYLPGGAAGGPMPLYRRLATRLHPLLMSAATGKRLTESTNGFRAIRLSMLNHPGFRLGQKWLDGYGLEIYLLYKAIRLGFRHVEVPCTKVYPEKRFGQTKMPAITGWWEMLRPVWLLGLGLKR